MDSKTLYSYFLRSSSVITDSRKIKKRALFFCLKGDNFNGNKFAEEALKKGASFVIVDDLEYFKENDQYILVDDCLKSLQELAHFNRMQFDIPVIGLTGSNGKTTTKELIKSVLSEEFRVTATFGNLNNHIGVPLTLLSINSKTEIALIEMGANHKKEINFLAHIAAPTIGYITNFGKAHLEGFGSLAGVIKGKSELYTYLAINNGVALINSEDPLQLKLTNNQNTYTFGDSKDAVLKIKSIILEPGQKLALSIAGKLIQSQIKGAYNYSNIKAAIAFGSYFNIPIKKIKKGIEKYIPTNNRSQWYKTDSNTLVLDSYNANPSSMKAALESFLTLTNTSPILILGDMLELGNFALDEHQKVIDYLSTKKVECILLIGSEFKKTQSEDSTFIKFDKTEQAISYLQKKKFQNKTILIKGSRGIALEQLQEYL